MTKKAVKSNRWRNGYKKRLKIILERKMWAKLRDLRVKLLVDLTCY